MTINLAPLVKVLAVVLVVGSWIFVQTWDGPDQGPDQPDGFDTGQGTRIEASRYLDAVAEQVARPGVYVDPAVFEDGALTRADADRLDAAARAADAPMRIVVLPAEKLQYDSGTRLSWQGVDLVGQVYDRVGADGIYAVLVHAGAGQRELSATQFAEEGPTYDVEGAVDKAVDCCAPHYGSMLVEFIEQGDNIDRPLWWWLLWITGIIALLGAVVGLIRWLQRRHIQKRNDIAAFEVLRVPLNEEVIELSSRVAALPPVPATEATGDAPSQATADVAAATKRVLDLVEDARQRLDTMKTARQATEVTTRLADARYWLTVISARRAGQPKPRRTPPCFFDPRHGPSTSNTSYRPDGGVERVVEACTACTDMVKAEQEPPVRTFVKDGRPVPYWDLSLASRPYLDGYWQRHWHPAPGAQTARGLSYSGGVERSAGNKKVAFVWQSSSSSSWSGGSRRRPGRGSGGGSSSSRSRSSGGGSSSRSSSRSSGSRRF